jgi:hypothetical protein
VSFPKTSPIQTAEGGFFMHQIVTNLSRQNTRYLKRFGNQEALFVMSLEEYELMASTQGFAFEKAMQNRDGPSYHLMFVMYAMDVI